MQKLVIRRGMAKTAALEDGPSLEQQFGILANAKIAEKFPQLDSMKLAFQLIEKKDGNSDAVGAVIYKVGASIIFVPAFLKGGNVKTADMMLLADTQQFLPMSDPWLAWLRDKDLRDTALIVPKEGEQGITNGLASNSRSVRDLQDPIIKTACVYLKGLLHTGCELEKTATGSLFDAVIGLGKTASANMLDNLTNDRRFLNAALHFYTGDQLQGFAKTAASLEKRVSLIEVIEPFDKKAKLLSAEERERLHKDGYLLRKYAAEVPSMVVRPSDVDSLFFTVDKPGKYKLLTVDGNFEPAYVFRTLKLEMDNQNTRHIHAELTFAGQAAEAYGNAGSAYDSGLTASSFIDRLADTDGMLAVRGESVNALPKGAMAVNDPENANKSIDDFNLSGISKKLSPSTVPELRYGDLLLLPGGYVVTCPCFAEATVDGKGWYGSCGQSIVLGTDDAQCRPLVTDDTIILPNRTRLLKGTLDNKAALTCVTTGTLPVFINNFCNAKYHKTKIYSDGSEYTVTGTKNTADEGLPVSVKQAALKLVSDYNVDPETASMMLREVSEGAHYNRPKSAVYWIKKTAAESAEWENANIGMTEFRDRAPTETTVPVPMGPESTEQLTKAIEAAAQQGIKEVFDVTSLKLLVRQNRFFDEIQDDIPHFMQTLDSLCRKLFQFYWHTDKMEEKYGLIKLKALEDSIKCSIDSLSELTIFFKLRTVDGSGITGDTAGDLMTGSML